MRDIILFILFLVTLVMFSSCAIVNRAGSDNDHFVVDKERLVVFTKEVLRENNLRIYSELERVDGTYEIIAFLPPEGREYPSEVTAINSLRVFLTPDEEAGYFVSVQQPPEHEMPRKVSQIDYEERLLSALNEMINPEEL